jgi:DNA replication protein DnaC
MTLAQSLKTLGLRHTAHSLDDLLALATKRRLSPVQFLELLCQGESQDKAKRSLELRLRQSRLGRFKPLCDFDWSHPSHIDRHAVEAVLQLDFIPKAHNVILVAPHGLGKTMLAKNILFQAISSGYSALFTTAAQLLLDLGAQDGARALELRLRHYAKPQLLCIDEVGYLSFDNRNADLLYEVVCRRYELKSLVLTTNLSFSDWPSIFPSATSATALLDRLIHHCTVLPIQGTSFRRRDAEAHANSSRPASSSR